MRLLTLPTWQTIIVDIVVWWIIHTLAVRIALHRPDDAFATDRGLYNVHPMEARLYEKVFLIKRWKHYLPDAGKRQRMGFSKARLTSKDKPYLERFVAETRRAEFAHYLQMLPAPLFFLLNEPWVGWFMIVYAVTVE